jgi:hypothetical protein
MGAGAKTKLKQQGAYFTLAPQLRRVTHFHWAMTSFLSLWWMYLCLQCSLRLLAGMFTTSHLLLDSS